ncbi:MAG: hypothetical protein FWE03_07350 [Firmicutes bacterium]|nr:hypothetical protein [Bacillota bacterium]
MPKKNKSIITEIALLPITTIGAIIDLTGKFFSAFGKFLDCLIKVKKLKSKQPNTKKQTKYDYLKYKF